MASSLSVLLILLLCLATFLLLVQDHYRKRSVVWKRETRENETSQQQPAPTGPSIRFFARSNAEFSVRARVINTRCEAKQYSEREDLKYADKLYKQLRRINEYSILACLPPKTGSTNMVRLFNALIKNSTIAEENPVFKNGSLNREFYHTIPRMRLGYSNVGVELKIGMFRNF